MWDTIFAYATEKLLRWGLWGSEQEFEVVYCLGVEYPAVDAPKQLQTRGLRSIPVRDIILSLLVEQKKLIFHEYFDQELNKELFRSLLYQWAYDGRRMGLANLIFMYINHPSTEHLIP